MEDLFYGIIEDWGDITDEKTWRLIKNNEDWLLQRIIESARDRDHIRKSSILGKLGG